MQRSRIFSGLLAVALLGALWVPAHAATVRQMNLEQIVDRAGTICRCTVLDVREGSVQVGGGEVPTVTYRLRVDEAFKGSFTEVKGEQIAEIQMVGKLKAVQTGAVRSLSPLPELPRLEVGRDYLLISTPPSSIGLSTTVGLGQGLFVVTGKAGEETAVNLNGNVGLFQGMDESGATRAAQQPAGPLQYSVLADMIRTIVSE